jgi:hypothetical protein
MKLGQTLGGLLNATWVASASFIMRLCHLYHSMS